MEMTTKNRGKQNERVVVDLVFGAFVIFICVSYPHALTYIMPSLLHYTSHLYPICCLVGFLHKTSTLSLVFGVESAIFNCNMTRL